MSEPHHPSLNRRVHPVSDAGQPRLPTLDLTALTILGRAARRIRHHLDVNVLYDAHLNWTSWDLLHLIVEHRGISTREVAASAAVSKAAVTRICGELIDRRLIERRRDDSDYRFVRLFATSRGRQLVDALLPRLVSVYEAYVSTGSSAAGDDLRAVLRELFLPPHDASIARP